MLDKSVLSNPGVGGDRAKYESLTENAKSRLSTHVPDFVCKFIIDNATLSQPDDIYICDGSEAERLIMVKLLKDAGIFRSLTKYKNSYIALSDPRDVARVEGKTVICTGECRSTVPIPKSGFGPSKEPSLPNLKCTQLGNWMCVQEGRDELIKRFNGCMKGRTMYVIPFCMGPLGSNLSKYGIELTDSAYVVVCMRIMTRMTEDVFNYIMKEGRVVRCLHSVGVPLPTSDEIVNNWPCNPSKTIVSHFPETEEIISFGSGYGAEKQNWLAEHMLILGLTNPKGVKKYIVAAFPSACGKTNLAMLTPTIPGYKVECVGDDIAWMRFNDEGRLVGINPENGLFGVAPGTSFKSNPNAMKTIFSDSIFTNVATTDDGGVFWEGIDKEFYENKKITSWKLKPWTKEGSTEPAAHPNSRFCTPAVNCPIMDKDWENPKGVPIDAIIFGGRRPEGVPLVYEAFDWNHGVFIGACVKSEATAAAEHKAKVVMHDPFAMRPFFGYNFGRYMQHWLNFKDQQGLKLPKIFHCNWFRLDNDNKSFLWPGFGENCRVLDWICRRCDNEDIAEKSPIGYIPKKDSINLEGLDNIDIDQLLSVPKEYWKEEVKEIRGYLDENVNEDLPAAISDELNKLEERVLCA
ncbi:hypothetical protein GJ496_009305 [Pomphorhynchus laevis]|nr:hypothetical protein GJ496_009305 [Pomphorhynchus laevis]